MSSNVTQDGLRRDSSEMPEEENLLLRRSEIINRLKEIDDTNDTIDDDLERCLFRWMYNSQGTKKRWYHPTTIPEWWVVPPFIN